MKKLFSLFIFLFAFCYQEKLVAQVATLNETMDWLSGHFNNLTTDFSWSHQGNQMTYIYSYEFTSEKCNIKLKILHKYYDSKWQKILDDHTITYTFNLADISKIKITPMAPKIGVVLLSSVYELTLTTYNGLKLIEANDKVKVSSICVLVNDHEMILRIEKAFNNALKLCGSKTEKF